MRTVSIIGIGRIGGALALALDKAGYKIENLFVRENEKAQNVRENLPIKTRTGILSEVGKIESDIIFICTQDAEIAGVAQILATKIAGQPFVFHTSGALSSEILSVLKTKNCCIGSIHPLVSISDSRRGAENFGAAYFCVEGEIEAVQAAGRIVADLGGNSFAIDSAYKTLYHAAAVTACGHLVALLDASFEMMNVCGFEEEKAKNILFPLIKSTLENLERQSAAAALTGTFARADAETFARHLETLEKNVSPEILEIYLLLGLSSLRLAEKQGTPPEKINLLQKEVLLAKKKLK